METQISQEATGEYLDSACCIGSNNQQHNDSRQDSRRSVDWRDSGIVIDEDHPFYSFDTIGDFGKQQQQLPFEHQYQQQEPRSSLATTIATPNYQYHSSSSSSQYSFSQDCDDDGDTILHLAVVGSTVDIVKDLIKRVAISPVYNHLDAINNMLHTPMHVATMANRPEMVELLLQSGAKYDIQDRRGNSPLHKACEKGFNEIVIVILDFVRKVGETTESGSNSSLRQLLEMANFDGQTCLHLAAIHDRRQTLEILISKYGAQVNCRDSKSGETILHKAVQRYNSNLVEFILSLQQQHCNEADYSNRTPLDLIEQLRDSRIAMTQRGTLAKIEELIKNRIQVCIQQNGCCIQAPLRKPIGELLSSSSSSDSDSGSSVCSDDGSEFSPDLGSDESDSSLRVNGHGEAPIVM